MMNFDTHATIKALREAGLDERQAEAITEAIRSGHGDLVTNASLRAELAELENRLSNKMYTFGLAIAGVMIAILKLT